MSAPNVAHEIARVEALIRAEEAFIDQAAAEIALLRACMADCYDAIAKLRAEYATLTAPKET